QHPATVERDARRKLFLGNLQTHTLVACAAEVWCAPQSWIVRIRRSLHERCMNAVLVLGSALHDASAETAQAGSIFAREAHGTAGSCQALLSGYNHSGCIYTQDLSMSDVTPMSDLTPRQTQILRLIQRFIG